MNKSELSFLLESIHVLAFVNPFSDQRDEVEEMILSKMGWIKKPIERSPKFTKEFNQVLHWVEQGEQALLGGMVEGFDSTLQAEQMASLAYFSLYHQLVDDLDTLIDCVESDSISNRKLFKKIELGIKQRRPLVLGARSALWEKPEHLFSCFYQLRRAFLCLFNEIVGWSEPVRALRVRVWESVFTKDMLSYQQWMHESVGRFPTLILGPTGSGKEIVARAIGLSRFIPYDSRSGQFASSPKKSFCPVNLSALTETLIESELFGHRKGSFTGAMRDHPGIFKKAGQYGTVFLDEIGEVPESIQVKLLRILQSGEFQAIGGDAPSFYEGKIIAATHRDLSEEVRRGRMREDFFYRLCGDQVNTVGLKEIISANPKEIENSITYICMKLFGKEGARELSARVFEKLQSVLPRNYSWPGNFRELEQAVRNIIVHDEFVPLGQGGGTELDIRETYRTTQLSLSEWNQIYARKAYENAGSYREAARRLDADQRTVKKLVLG
ncbi:sigma-54 factor interaction domain-containing protein [Opitutales bacterium]|nr:sigma-54 factor interaction domain-containing protein [Opitutales bacterium]